MSISANAVLTGNAGGLLNRDMATLRNSTLAGNHAGDSGGGLIATPYDHNPTAYLNNVTMNPTTSPC